MQSNKDRFFPVVQRAVMVFLLLVTVYGISASEEKISPKFYPLESHSQFAVSAGLFGASQVIKWSVLSEVVYVGAAKDLLRETTDNPSVKAFLHEVDAPHHSSQERTVYQYSYRFRNNSAISIRIVFANAQILGSPLIDLFGDFAFTLQPMETISGTFWANGMPQSIPTSTYIAVKNRNLEWQHTEGTIDTLYIPPSSFLSPSLYVIRNKAHIIGEELEKK